MTSFSFSLIIDPIVTTFRATRERYGLLRALLEAIHGQDDQLAGRAFTRALGPLTVVDSVLAVESTISFGENVDGAGDARLLVDGEVMLASGRTSTVGAQTFTGLTRGADGTMARTHVAGAIVLDASGNRSARDLVRRGLFVNTARLGDLDVVGRNLGLHKCPGLTEEQWRRVIKAIAYAPKTLIASVDAVLEAYYGNTTDYQIVEQAISNPYNLLVLVTDTLATSTHGRFYLNGGELALTTGLTTVVAAHPIRNAQAVVLASTYAKRGGRDGLTNYYSSFVGSTITLGSSPGAIGTPVLIDYAGAGTNHYLADNETVLDDHDNYPYLTDTLGVLSCLANQVRPFCSGVTFKFK